MFRTRTAGAADAVDRDGRGYRQRRRGATGARGSAGAGLLARVVHLVVSIVVLIIVVGILLIVLKANATNNIVAEIQDWARWLTGPFDGMFSFDNARVAVAVNWGIAAVVYLLIGGLITRVLSRAQR